MIDQNDIKKIRGDIEEFFQKTTIIPSKIEINTSSTEKEEKKEPLNNITDVVNLNITLLEPQILIGEGGQTLFEIQRILRSLLTKKIQKSFYLNLDINEYKQKKIEYLKELAKELADEVVFTKKERAFSPMPSYERRVIHSELSQRYDVVTESRGEGEYRHVVIKPNI